MTCKATAAVAALAAALTLAPTAGASLLPAGPLAGGGGFVIQSCGESGSSQGWTATNNAAARVETFTDCPPALGRIPEFPANRFYTGLHAGGKRGRDSATLDDAQAGDQAELTFTATSGTQITRVRMWREVAKGVDNDWWPYVKAGSTTISSCEITVGGGTCHDGSPGAWAPNGQNDMDPGYESFYDSALPANLPSLAVSTFTVGILCRAQGNNICGNDYLVSSAFAEVYSAFLTLADTSTPTLGPTSPEWTATTTITSSPAFLVSGTDNSGVRAARLYLDDVQVAEQQIACSYDRPRPCNDLTASGPLGFDPTTVADGSHQVQLAVVDAAGNETRTAPTARTIDGTPPPAPEITTTDSGANSTTVNWQPPSAGSGPVGVAGALWRYCQYNGPCTEPVSTAASANIQVTSTNFFQSVRVRLVDTLGREGPEQSVTLPYARPAGTGTSTTTTGSGTPTTPTTTPTPVARTRTSLVLAKPAVSRRRTVTLVGTVGIKRATLTVTLTRKGHKRITRRVKTTNGRYKLKIVGMPRGRWKVAVRYAGSSSRQAAAAVRAVTVR